MLAALRTICADRRVQWALFAALVLRVVPLAVWPQFDCVRDECIYRTIANKIVEGEGLTVSPKGWLPAPAYPYLLAASKVLTGSLQPVKWLQVLIGTASVAWLAAIADRVGGRRAAVVAAWLLAINPTAAWFTTTLWIETIYLFLLLASIEALLRARAEDRVGPAAMSGIWLGIAVLFRGVATYLPPIFLLATLMPMEGRPTLRALAQEAGRRWPIALAFTVAAVLVVAPYSWKASQRHGGFLVSDATVGHVLYLGNNDFPPLTFDYGNGMLTGPLYSRWLREGRPPCPRDQPPVLSSACEVKEAVQWMTEHPEAFIERMPIRVAQLVNPHSFFTRHLRWGYWHGLPWWGKEALVLFIALHASAIMVLGTLGAWARARGPFGVMSAGTTLYTVGTIAIMYGMTRFRLPLEPLWTVYLAILIAEPGETWRSLLATPWRIAGAILTIPPLVVLMTWYLPTGWPMAW